MSLLSDVSRAPKRVMPVIILADVSGSMAAAGKIQALNAAIGDMLKSFGAEDNPRTEIQVCIITFGAHAKVHAPLQDSAELMWHPMRAQGSTPMGAAMTLARELIEDREAIPRKAYRPTVILVTDGLPTDQYKEPMRLLISEGRSRKADRMALAIGKDADVSMLREFLNDPERQVFRAEDASQIHQFFQYATMSMTLRSLQSNPNQVPSSAAVAKHYSLPNLPDPFSQDF